MQKFDVFREIEGIQNKYDIEKRHIYIYFANWKWKLVSFDCVTSR